MTSVVLLVLVLSGQALALAQQEALPGGNAIEMVKKAVAARGDGVEVASAGPADDTTDADETTDAAGDGDAGTPADPGASTEADQDAAAPEPEPTPEPEPDPEPGRLIAGWVEHVYIEPWGYKLKAKLDTGAQTSSMSAREIEYFLKPGKTGKGAEWVRFDLHLDETEDAPAVLTVEQPVVREAKIRQHGRVTAVRPVVKMPICFNGEHHDVEFTLTPREGFVYPILLGRTFLSRVALIDPNHTFVVAAECEYQDPPVGDLDIRVDEGSPLEDDTIAADAGGADAVEVEPAQGDAQPIRPIRQPAAQRSGKMPTSNGDHE